MMSVARQFRKLITIILPLSQILPMSTGLCPSSDNPKDGRACQDASPLPKGVSPSDKQLILSTHNSLRAKQPASDMQLMIWDDGLAFAAQKWSEGCIPVPNFPTDISLIYLSGQSLAVGQSSWKDTISYWYGGFSLLKYRRETYNSSRIENVIQILRNSTARIGCGFSTCINLSGRKFYVCYYLHSEDKTPTIGLPYTKGTRCADCPKRCANGLCDCGGLVCEHGQKLNLETCACISSSVSSSTSPDCIQPTTTVGITTILASSTIYSPTQVTKTSATPTAVDLIPSSLHTTSLSSKVSTSSTLAATTGQSLLTYSSIASVTASSPVPASTESQETTAAASVTQEATTVTTITKTSPPSVPTSKTLSTAAPSVTQEATTVTTITKTSPPSVPTSTTLPTAAPSVTQEATTVTTITKTSPPSVPTSTTLQQTSSVTPRSDGCPSPSYPPTHTACLSTSPNAVSPRGVAAKEQALIVNYHNYLRRLKAATDMQLMVWDDEVAYIAQKWSDNCAYGHDTKRYVPGKYSAGQNIAYGFGSWNDTILAWYNEVNQFTYGDTNYKFENIGHYTQMVWNSSAKIGCGATTCTNLVTVFYVCNYAPAGNIIPQIPTPYTNGSRCSACPDRCNNGLCDCGGLVCMNGGTLDLNTCRCACQSPYTGLPDCSLNCTGVVDKWYCGTQWPSSYCSKYINVPYDCPVMCSICPAAKP